MGFSFAPEGLWGQSPQWTRNRLWAWSKHPLPGPAQGQDQTRPAGVSGVELAQGAEAGVALWPLGWGPQGLAIATGATLPIPEQKATLPHLATLLTSRG